MQSILIRVKIGFDKKLNKYIAIKILNNNSYDNLYSFLKEIKNLASIHNKNIKRNKNKFNLNKLVKILDFGFNEQINYQSYQKNVLAYYVMDLAIYGELYKVLYFIKDIPENIVKYIFLEILEAIDILHQKNIYHRDLKPENILINEYFEIILCDFGSSAKSKNGLILCNNIEEMTLEYMAPEVIDNKEKNLNKYLDGSKMDLFSMGCILFILMTKSQPFRSSRKSDIYYKKLIEDKNSFWKIFETERIFSKEFKNLIEELLINDPNQRINIKNIRKHKWFENLKNYDKLKNDFKYFIQINFTNLLDNINDDIKKINQKQRNNENNFLRQSQKLFIEKFLNSNQKLIIKLKNIISQQNQDNFNSSSSSYEEEYNSFDSLEIIN